MIKQTGRLVGACRFVLAGDGLTLTKPPSERSIRTGGKKILSGTFPEADYLGLADIPAGANLRLTLERTVRSKRIYLRKAEVVL